MSDEEYEIPLQDQRVFGAGIKRKRVRFVPSSSTESVAETAPAVTSATSVADRYLSLVLSTKTSQNAEISPATGDASKPGQSETVTMCPVCNLPIDESTTAITTSPDADGAIIPSTRPHASSLAHQVCLPHSHPPSHVDRTRKGLTILSAYGWDPDSRRGLGSEGQGIQFPIKTKPKDDKLGLGVVVPKGLEKDFKKKRVQKLDAGKVRKLEERDRRRREALQEMFYRSDEVERYLGQR